MGVWSHHSAGLRLVLGAVFPPGTPPPAEGDELVPVSIAWDETEGDEKAKLTAALGACWTCHEATLKR